MSSHVKSKPLDIIPLPASLSLFRQLADERIRFGIFKSSKTTPEALAGRQDMDVIVARNDYSRFCRVLEQAGAVRGSTHRSLVSIGREDWFVPDLTHGAYLHLDVHVEIRLGRKFNKHFPAFTYENIDHWVSLDLGDTDLPVVSPEDEARVTLSRIAFRSGLTSFGPWITLSGDWEDELRTILFSGSADQEKAVTVRYVTGVAEVGCRLRGGRLQVHRHGLAMIRRLVRTAAGESAAAEIGHVLAHLHRKASYYLSRVWVRAFPGAILDRRRPATGGIVVALVAPDGLGKSSQVSRLQKIFAWKFSTTQIYMGTGDGGGWLPRKLIVALYKRRRASIRSAMALDADNSGQAVKSASLKRRFGATAMSIYGWLAASERHAKVRKARRMANRGFIVLADRWPQDLQHGYLDGPVQLQETLLFPALRFFRRREIRLFEQMRAFRPDVTFHMVADHSVSVHRKPGEISQQAFTDRLALMERLRKSSDNCIVVDASRPMDAVTAQIFSSIWQAL